MLEPVRAEHALDMHHTVALKRLNLHQGLKALIFQGLTHLLGRDWIMFWIRIIRHACRQRDLWILPFPHVFPNVDIDAEHRGKQPSPPSLHAEDFEPRGG